jgi:hypothetical protein
VFREIPRRSAICVHGTHSAPSLLINAQSSKVITLRVSSAHFRPAGAQFSTVIDTLSGCCSLEVVATFAASLVTSSTEDEVRSGKTRR